MDGYQFEKECAKLLRKKGFYNVKVTKKGHEQGVDIIAHKRGLSYAVQCKYYSSPVGNKAIQEVYTGGACYHCNKYIVMTNNTFTKSAKDVAKKTGVELWKKCKPDSYIHFNLSLKSVLCIINIFYLIIGILSIKYAKQSGAAMIEINRINGILLVSASLFGLFCRSSFVCEIISSLVYLLFAISNTYAFRRNMDIESSELVAIIGLCLLPAIFSLIYAFQLRSKKNKKAIIPTQELYDNSESIQTLSNEQLIEPIKKPDFCHSASAIQNNKMPTEPVQEAYERLAMYNDNFDYMTGADFEEYCADLLRRNGFTDVSVTSTSGDFGADILATQNKVKYAIQCKRYSSDVGIDAVYQISGGLKYYDTNIGVVLTNRYFTKQARELATKIGIVLWDRDFLLNLIDERSESIPVSTFIQNQEFGRDPFERDVYFEEAGEFIIEKGKVSIGMLQRMFKIGFNRAARIIDQLYDAGVVGPDEYTKPRKVLMSMEEFESYIETHL